MGFVFRTIGRILARLIIPAIFLAVGWYGGAKYGAPDIVIRGVDGIAARTGVALAPIVDRGGEIAAEGVERGGELAADAVEQGGEYVVGTVEQMLEDLAEGPQQAEPGQPEDRAGETQQARPEPRDAGAAPSSIAAADGDIVLCPRMSVSNAPRANADRVVRKAGATVRYKGVELLLMPATKSCLSSGYGNRNGRLHKGVDYYTKENGAALAAGDGVIVEAVSRSDYGNMVVIDHGNGVFTRYAHLARFGSGVREGASVRQGQTLGPIGTSGATSVKHLHWELLTGDYDTRAGSFGLDPVDPFSV